MQLNTTNYSKVPEHMRVEVTRVLRREIFPSRGIDMRGIEGLRLQTLSALQRGRGHFRTEKGPLDLDFKREIEGYIRGLGFRDEGAFSDDFIKKLATVIPKQKEIEKKVIRLVLKTYKNLKDLYVRRQGGADVAASVTRSLEALNDLVRPDSELLERYRDQLLVIEILKALGIRSSELRSNIRNNGYSLATTRAYITHKNPLNRPNSNNQRLVTNNDGRLRSEHSVYALVRFFLWPIYYKKKYKFSYVKTIVPANINPDYLTLNNFKNGNKVIGYGDDPKYHEYVSQNSFRKLAKMTPTEAFLLRSKNKRVPLFKHPTIRNRFVTQHDLRFITLNINTNRRYNKAAVKIQSRYKGGKYRNTQIKIANEAEKKLAAAKAKFNQAKKLRDVITKRKNKSASKRRTLSASKRRTTTRATASKNK